jgi:hypothetical protein
MNRQLQSVHSDQSMDLNFQIEITHSVSQVAATVTAGQLKAFGATARKAMATWPVRGCACSTAL